jgi:FkbM family methyltransferase
MILRKYRDIKNIYSLSRHFKNANKIMWCVINKKNIRQLTLMNGIRFKAPHDNSLLHMTYEVFIKNIYLPNYLSIGANDIVVDIGANIGLFSIFAAKFTRNKIYAIEPYPENVKYLKENITLNNFQNNIKIYPVAISDYNGIKKLYLSEISGGHLLFDHNISGSLVDYIKVKTKTLQQIIDENSLEKIDYLKMDCEGSEGHILKSTPQKYLQKIRSIVLEFHNNVSILNHYQIINLLSDSGYKCNLNWDNKSEFGYIFATRG